MWVLTAHLNDTHNVTKWQTQEGAIAYRERLLEPKSEPIFGTKRKRMVWPDGWTAITRQSSASRANGREM